MNTSFGFGTGIAEFIQFDENTYEVKIEMLIPIEMIEDRLFDLDGYLFQRFKEIIQSGRNSIADNYKKE